ncbi:hypothetical protein [Chitinophaga rhizosphaerae]|uniref:hypothetical protein n=1 Tax=Chitinophaga rhizosphaerae TaxID=1864947 RepID=UPI000F80ED37|nr:hypothetical protein [Chitinophaga rhizosphaerae]
MDKFWFLDIPPSGNGRGLSTPDLQRASIAEALMPACAGYCCFAPEITGEFFLFWVFCSFGVSSGKCQNGHETYTQQAHLRRQRPAAWMYYESMMI